MRRALPPLLLLTSALVVYGALALRHPIGTYATETDFYHYYGPDAARLSSWRFPENPFQGPGYPGLVATFAPIAGGTFAAGKWVSVACAAALIALVYLLFAQLCGKWVGWGAALLVAVSPEFPQFAISATTDVFFLLLCVAWLYVFTRDTGEAKWTALVGGAIAGAAYLTRYNGLFLIIAGIWAISLLNIFERGRAARGRLVALFLAAFIVVASPWLIANYRHRGSPFYNRNYLNIATEFYPELTSGRVNQDGTRGLEERFRSFGDVIRHDPARLVRHYPRNLWESFLKTMRAPLIIPWVGYLGLFGLALALATIRSKRIQLAAGATLLYFLLMGLNHWEERYYFFVMVIYSGFAVDAVFRSFALARSRHWLARREWIAVPVLIVAILWGISIAEARKETGIFLASHPWEVLSACDYLRGQGVTGARVLARKPHIAAICDQEWVFFPDVDSIDELREFLRANPVDYLAFGIRELKTRRELKALRDPSKAPAWLAPVYSSENPPLILYRPIIEAGRSLQ